MSDFEFEVLSRMSDYSETAEIIYDTDPYIYKDLFGDKESALKVLSYSFDNIDSVFYKSAVYVVRHCPSGEIVATALFHTKDFLWDVDKALEDFAKANVTPPNSFYAASEYMKKTYNFQKIGCSMCNVCVNKSYRHRGIAQFMLSKILDSTKDKTVEVCVLKDNTSAINLYKKLGFQIIGDAFEDYGGYELPPVLCYKMVLNRF